MDNGKYFVMVKTLQLKEKENKLGFYPTSEFEIQSTLTTDDGEKYTLVKDKTQLSISNSVVTIMLVYKIGSMTNKSPKPKQILERFEPKEF